MWVRISIEHNHPRKPIPIRYARCSVGADDWCKYENQRTQKRHECLIERTSGDLLRRATKEFERSRYMRFKKEVYLKCECIYKPGICNFFGTLRGTSCAVK